MEQCSRDKEINTLSIQYNNMAEKIDKIEEKVDNITDELWEIKTLIQDIKIDNERRKNDDLKESTLSNEKVRTWINDNFASKKTENIVYWILGVIGTGVITAIITYIIK